MAAPWRTANSSLEAFADGAEGETTGAQGLVDHAEDLGAILVREPDRGGWNV